jgi:hypothetical protein
MNLREVSLDNNPLHECPQNLPESLKTLSISYCELRKIRRFPSALKTLRAFYNKIHSLDAPLPLNLHYCNLAHNCLSSISLQRLPNLTYLNLDCNRITWLPNNLPDTLETLIVSNNKLTSLPETLPRNLSMLVLCRNTICSFNIQWKLGQHIKTVFIRDNCLTENLALNTHIDKVYQDDNWNDPNHSMYASIIQRAYSIYKIRKVIRIWRRTYALQRELLDISLHPNFVNRWNEVDTWKEWKH